MSPPGRARDPDSPIQFVKGIGPRRAAALAERGISTVRDLLYYFPFGYVDLNKVEKIGNVRRLMDSGQWVTFIGTVRAFDLVGRPPRQRLVLVLDDETGSLQLVFFRSVHYFKKAFTVGELIAASGKVTSFGSRPQLVHPSVDRLSASDDEEEGGALQGFLHTLGIIPKYGSSEDLRDVNLHVKGIRRIMKTVVDEYADSLEEIMPPDILARHRFLPLPAAIRGIHFPESAESLDRARRRLKFDEFFGMQLMLAHRRMSARTDVPGIAFTVESKLARNLVDSLPFRLTNAQKRVIREITDDMKVPKPMHRLLQGDVGSGKTVVALTAMLIAIENGYQAAFMAPTEILAEQHYRTLAALMTDIPVNVRLLIGGQRTRLRRDILEDIRRGSASMIVGTHALIQSAVDFANLGFIVIDEQHRFGVSQRIALQGKGMQKDGASPSPDVLVMSATPIPRTLSLTLYGDLDVSVIDEMPASRRPIRTALRTESQRSSVDAFIREEVGKGRQAYVVYPLVEESEKVDLKAAVQSYEHLASETFSDLRVGLIHGQMPPDEKDAVMDRFKRGGIDVLVSTTVIEVGIDVPNASVMVIEHAERFGLSQLHQLRGRVGRGADQSYCILIAPDWLGKLVRSPASLPGITGEPEDDQRKAERRLRTMLETNDGFKIAEIDLELRGPGEFFGTRQSGLPELRLANLVTDMDILSLARTEAFGIIDRDPDLTQAGHEELRKYFFDRLRRALELTRAG